VVGRIVQVGRGVDTVDLNAGLRDEARTALSASLQRRTEPIGLPSLLVLLPARSIGHDADDAAKTDAAATGMLYG
jgi:hypothetical protein